MLYEYLKDRYEMNEPIFLSDVKMPVSDVRLRQMFKILCDSGKIKRYDNGIYYFPPQSRLKGGTSIAPSVVAQYKYIDRNGKIDGYYSGFTFANQMGVTKQVPYTLEIVSNASSANTREVSIKGQRIILRKPKTTVTNQNYRTLQFLDLLKDIDMYTDEDETKDRVSERLTQYVKAENISQREIDKYISLYPDKVYKNLYEMRLYNVFT